VLILSNLIFFAAHSFVSDHEAPRNSQIAKSREFPNIQHAPDLCLEIVSPAH
jgi:hypothetical protein